MAKAEAIDFNQIIQADRERRKNEALASEIFGAGRRSSAPGVPNGPRKATQTPSLASRIGGGISKPTPRASSASGQRSARPFGSAAPASKNILRPVSTTHHQARSNRLESALSSENASAQVNLVPRQPPSRGLTIRGTAGPFVVQASNFQFGTTAADIQNVLVDIAGPGATKACRIVKSHPTVVAEMTFAEKSVADTVVETLNGEKADGRTLRCHLKMAAPSDGSLSALLPQTQDSMMIEEALPANAAAAPMNVDAEMSGATDTSPSTLPPQGASPFEDGRQTTDRNRRDDRRAEPDIQDGRFGFEARQEREYYKAQHHQAQDELERHAKQNEDAREANRQADQNRGHDRDRDRDRDRQAPSAYNNSNYGRREADSYRRDDGRYRGSGYRRDDRPLYGNGVAGRGRGYDDRNRSGRMYSDAIVPERRGPPRNYR
ncbi:MAG: hypothetical protein Q9160_003320 [Pyrenula sp. 1 TL-2023]